MTIQQNGATELQVLDAPPLRSGTPVVIGAIPSGSLVGRHVIPRRDHAHRVPTAWCSLARASGVESPEPRPGAVLGWAATVHPAHA